jgi:hypothetical protein
MAASVREEIHKRFTGRRQPEASAMKRKMSSPSRPASVAQMTWETSGAVRARRTMANCGAVFSKTRRGHRRGNMGSVSKLHRRHWASMPSGSSRPTMWPMAQVTR